MDAREREGGLAPPHSHLSSPIPLPSSLSLSLSAWKRFLRGESSHQEKRGGDEHRGGGGGGGERRTVLLERPQNLRRDRRRPHRRRHHRDHTISVYHFVVKKWLRYIERNCRKRRGHHVAGPPCRRLRRLPRPPTPPMLEVADSLGDPSNPIRAIDRCLGGSHCHPLSLSLSLSLSGGGRSLHPTPISLSLFRSVSPSLSLSLSVHGKDSCEASQVTKKSAEEMSIEEGEEEERGKRYYWSGPKSSYEIGHLLRMVLSSASRSASSAP